MAKQQELQELIERQKAANDQISAKIQKVIEDETDNISEESLQALREVVTHSEEIASTATEVNASAGAGEAAES